MVAATKKAAPAKKAAAPKGTSDSAKKREAYAAAEKRLRTENADAFVRLLNEEHAARGMEYKPRRTAQEREAAILAEKRAKALAAVKAAAEQFPGLLDELSPQEEEDLAAQAQIDAAAQPAQDEDF